MSNEKLRLSAIERLNLLFDEGSFSEIGSTVASYGKKAGVITGFGTVDGVPAYAFSQDSKISSGAVDKMHARKIEKLYDLAVKTGAPIIGIYDSLGGNLNEGTAVMESYSNILKNISAVSGVVPQISVIVGNCGGATAIAACSADVVVASENAEIFMASPFKENNGQTAEKAYICGIVSNLCKEEEEAIIKAKEILNYLPKNNLEQPSLFEYQENTKQLTEDCTSAFMASDAAIDYESKTSLYAGFGSNCETAFATISGVPVGMISIDGEIDLSECSKIARLANLCDCFNIPLITFMNSEGFKTKESMDAMFLRESSKLSHVLNDSTMPKIFIATGNAFGSSYITLSASADIKLAFPSAVISPLPPKTAAAILCEDEISKENSREQVSKQFVEEHVSACAVAENGVIDRVICPANIHAELKNILAVLCDKRVARLPKKHSNIPM